MQSKPRLLLACLALLALSAVFMLYTQPDFIVQMGNQLWGCF